MIAYPSLIFGAFMNCTFSQSALEGFPCRCGSWILLLVSLLPIGLNAQHSGQVLNEADLLLLSATYSVVAPGRDLAIRFGPGFTLGGQVEGHLWPGNWILGGDFQTAFGAKVKEDVLGFLKDANGQIVGRDLQLSQAFLQQRQLMASGYVGKLIPLVRSNKRSGVRVTLGGGYSWHWVKVNDEMASLPQVEGEYGKGYDRLTTGPLTTQFFGYQHISLNRRIIFLIGADFSQGFTKSRRDYDYQTMRKDDAHRLDLMWGLRLGWSICLFSGSQSRDIYY